MESYSGKTLGNRYEVGELIGEGGMAVVYKAYDPMENRVVAIKILKEEFVANEEFRRRFKNESRAISMLSHPNIVKVYDVYFSEHLEYIVMEYIEGITLKEYIKQQKIVDWKESVHFTTQILRALQHAHDKGIVHRDIKPQNIMVLQNGDIKVADFGIARFSRGETRTITENGAIGSVHYISPEQARGELTDAQADIYSVGVVLYEMITGRLPFDSESSVSVALMQVQAEPVRPRDVNPAIPIGLEQISLHAMQKDKGNRYHTASEMLIDLDEFKRNPSIKFDYGFTTVSRNEHQNGYRVDRSYGAEVRPEQYNRRAENEYRIDPPPRPPVYTEPEDDEDDEEFEEEKSKNVLLPVLIGVFSALVLGIILIGIFVIKPNIGNKTVEVPKFVGQKYEDVLKNYPDFKFEDPPVYVYNEQYEEGYVCEQSEKEGSKIKKDTVIRLSVASGEGVAVENVVGYQYSDAQRILRSYGFSVKIVPEKSSAAEEGEVLRTSPEANSVVQYGSVVTLYVATTDDSAPVKVPYLVGKTEAEAKKALEEAGLIVGNVTEKYGNADNKGLILSQSPEKDTELAKGASVDYVISKGEQEPATVTVKVKMPNSDGASVKASAYINGSLSSETNARLDGADMSFTFSGVGKNNEFKIYIESFLLADGIIDFTANPATFTVSHDFSSEYVVKKAIPDVRNLSLSNAKKLLENEGFTNIVTLEQETDSYTPGVVISQSPNYSTGAYELDQQITLVVAKAVVTVADPQNDNRDEPSPDE